MTGSTQTDAADTRSTTPRSAGGSASSGLRRRAIEAAVVAALAAASPSALAASFADLTPVPSSELRALRGGMEMFGIEFEFGAVSTVTLDGTTVARTTLLIAGDGSLTRTLEIPDPSLATDFDATAAPVPGIDPGALAALRGVVVPGADGASIALSDIGAAGITAALLNTAPGRDIRQSFDISITIDDFSALEARLGGAATVTRALSGLRDLQALGSF